MHQKLKIIFSILGIIMVLAIGIVIYNLGQEDLSVEINSNVKTTAENSISATTSPVIGDKEIDKSINENFNDVLIETNLDSEFEDIEFTLSEEEDLNSINNLFNDNEL